jgi:hypothetical protein
MDFLSNSLITSLLIVLLVSGCASNSKVYSSIVIHNSGSTNTNGFELTVNADGSGEMIVHSRTSQTNLSTRMYPEGTLDYSSLKIAIEAVPDITASGQCAKSASFGTTESVSFDNKVSGDLTCPIGAEEENLAKIAWDVIIQANCFESNDTDCQNIMSIR